MLARRTVNPAVRTAWARRDPTVSYVPGWAQAPDIGRALLTTLRTVAGLRDRAPRPWTGSWTEPSVQPVRSGPSAARLRGIRAARAHDARGRSSHNPPVVGSSPTRPTQYILSKNSKNSDWQAPTVWFREYPDQPSRARPYGATRGSLRISLGDLARTRGDTLEG
jgi:hypothetical protein